MASKRSRIARSSSGQGEVALLLPAAMCDDPSRSRPTRLKRRITESMQQAEQPHRAVMELGLPILEPYEKDRGCGEFLKACFLCGKKLANDDTLFMYGSLGAFCSDQCREHQINIDKSPREYYSNQMTESRPLTGTNVVKN